MQTASVNLWASKVIMLACALLLLYFGLNNYANRSSMTSSIQKDDSSISFLYTFDTESLLSESDSLKRSRSRYWWLDSGGLLIIEDGTGHTISGSLEEGNVWQKLYANSSSIDTDGGFHPQNLFRLFTLGKWQNFSQEARFYVSAYNLSESSNRNESNGILLVSRYLDEDNLYYAGVRVDGHAVIKKKIKGIYYTLAEKQILPGSYDRDRNPNLIPLKEWFGVRSEIRTLESGDVSLDLFTARGINGPWEKVLGITDFGEQAPVIQESGLAGIRTDFMDVNFENYSLIKKKNEKKI